MKIYTRTGDSGQTGLGTGERVSKLHTRIVFCGTLDELNASLGVALSFCNNEEIKSIVEDIQSKLFLIGSDVSLSLKEGKNRISLQDVSNLESVIDKLESQLLPLSNFILPGGSKLSSLFHFSRAICRRTERQFFRLLKKEKVREEIGIYLNRLSDLLFVLARYSNKLERAEDTIWKLK